MVVFKRKKRLRSDIFGRARGRFIRDAHTFSVNVFVHVLMTVQLW